MAAISRAVNDRSDDEGTALHRNSSASKVASNGRTAAALEAVGVSKNYGAQPALLDVDLTAECGRIHAVLGPNGAGKTTLLRILLGLVRSDAGTIRMLGGDLEPGFERIPDGVAGVIDGAGFYPYLSGRRNLALLARLDRDRAPGAGLIDSAIERVGLERHADVPVAAYSAGTRQRLALAAALVRAPRLVLCDEPTSSLDPSGAQRVRALTRELAADGTAVVLSSHDMAEVEELSDSVSILHHGRIIFAGSVEQLRTRAGGAIRQLRTSDNAGALALASASRDIRVSWADDRTGLEAAGSDEAIDSYVVALGRAGIAVRSLQHRQPSLEDLFLQLTAERGERWAGSAAGTREASQT
jgi:ABC-2 type transport system ATP-binding protein